MLHAQPHKTLDTSSLEKRNTKRGKYYSEQINNNNEAIGSKVKIQRQCYTIARWAYWKRMETNMEKGENSLEKSVQLKRIELYQSKEQQNKLFRERE